MRSETFLKMYRVLEGLLEEKYGRASSVVMEYLNNPDSEPVRSQLDLCRELRNLLTHNAGENGEPVCEPSAETLDSLYAIISHVQKPRPAINAATPASTLLTAGTEDLLLPVIAEMDRQGFSSVPILSDGRITGVLSASSLLSYLAHGGYINAQTRLRHLSRYLTLDGRSTGRYSFLSAEASCNEAIAAFESHSARNNRLLAIFITRDGSPDQPLLGMLTPWDVVGKED